MTTHHQYEVVDSFTRTPLAGNPVAAFFDCDDLDPRTMQELAAELHLSETTFVSRARRPGDAAPGDVDADVRIFTPVNELGFAGHPLLGTALALAIRSGRGDLRLATAKGRFAFRVTELASQDEIVSGHVEMEQPDPVVGPYQRSSELLAALGLTASTLPVEVYDVGPRHVFVGVPDEAALAAVRPDLRALAGHENMAAICFSPGGGALAGAPGTGAGTGTTGGTATGEGVWRTRMFSPAYGVAEDAATGSAAGPFALHLARHGVAPYGRRVPILQGVELGRPSHMYGVAYRDPDGTVRLVAGGYAVRVAQGRYTVPSREG